MTKLISKLEMGCIKQKMAFMGTRKAYDVLKFAKCETIVTALMKYRTKNVM